MEGCSGTTCQACVTLTFDLPEWKFQMVLLLIKMNNHAKLFWNQYMK